MKHFILAAALTCVAGLAMAQTTAAPAASAPKAKTAQQSKMGACNEQAGDKKGDERKAFMKSCLSAKAPEAAASGSAKTAQQEKMKTCNADAKAKNLAGAERKAFMKDCLSAK